MSSVLVGMFDTRPEADKARASLFSAGFAPSPVSSSSDIDDDDSETSRKEGGGLMGFLHNIFGGDESPDNETHTHRFKEAFRRGAFGLTVPTRDDDETDRASDLLNDAGAIDVDERSRTEGWSQPETTPTAAAAVPTAAKPMPMTGQAAIAGSTQMVNVVEERLAVGKRAVAKGGVRVFSRVVEMPVEETVHLRDEQASIQRRVVDRPATEADFAAFKEGSIEVRSTAEEAVVSKTARVVGEVEIGTQVTERDQTVRDTVRKTEVDVEQLPGGTVATTDLPKP